MKNKNQLSENYKSSLISELLEGIDPKEKERIKKRMLLAARIDDAIKAKGWKPKNFAEALGKSPSEISKWLSGTHNFTADTLFDIERVLDVVLISLGNQPERTIGICTFNIMVKADKQPLPYFGSSIQSQSMVRSQLTA